MNPILPPTGTVLLDRSLSVAAIADNAEAAACKLAAMPSAWPRCDWAVALLRRTWLRIVILVVCGFVVHFPALHGDLIWDDQYLARDNPLIKSPLLIGETFRHYLFLNSFSTHYRPLQNVSYCLDYLLWDNESSGYHLTNILLHVGSGILLYFLATRLLRQLMSRGRTAPFAEAGASASKCATGGFFVALLWLVHPVHSAAVDYISGRADSLAALFALGGWLIYERGRAAQTMRRRVLFFAGAGLAALAALCSRETAGIWLLLFLLTVCGLDRSLSWRGRLAVVAVCLGIAASYVALRDLPGARELPAAQDVPIAQRAVLMLRALGDYARLMIFPRNLHMDRSVEAPAALAGRLGWRQAIASEYLSIAGLIALAAFLAGVLWRGKARPVRVYGAAWFVLAYLPTSNLIPLNATVAEHWLYLPSIGFLMFLSGCVLDMPAGARRSIACVATAAVLALGIRSFVRSGDWINPETFYRHSLAAGAAQARMALNLAQILTEKGNYAEAERILRRVLAFDPDYPIAQNAYAHLLSLQGKTKEAERIFVAATAAAEKARHEYPRTWVAALNLAHSRVAAHDEPHALEVVRGARSVYPGIWELISFEAELLRRLEGPRAALPLVEEFARQNWWHSAAAIALGKLYSEAGENAAAEAAFRHASRLDVHAVEALNLLALLELRQNRLDVACDAQRRAVSRQPDQPRQYLILSDILGKMGRTGEARAALAEVSRLQLLAQSTPIAN